MSDYALSESPAVDDELAFTGSYFEPAYDATSDDFDSWSDEELDAYLASDDDEYYGPPGLPYLESTVSDATRAGIHAGLEPLRQLAEEQARTDAYWQERDARRNYEDWAVEQQQLQVAAQEADRLVAEAGEKYDCRTSAANGTVAAWAKSWFENALHDAAASGDGELFDRINSPEGARAAIEYAAYVANNEAIKNRALNVIGGKGP